jgi:hypothetical protein
MSFSRFLILLCFMLVSYRANAQFDTLPPFNIEIEAVTNASVPGLHSCAFARSGSKWLFVGGRNNGLHGFSSNDGFPTQYANNDLLVIDTASWQYWTAPLTDLHDSIADPLRSTNMEYWQEGNYLYMAGGYGYDSLMNNYVTFPKLSALRVDSIISSVVAGTGFSQHIRQLYDTCFAVCGGDLVKYNSDYYLVFGHKFQGRYTDPPTPLFIQRYSNRIRKFTLLDNGVSLSISNYSEITDAVNFHRRDLNVGPVVDPGGGFSFTAYGGVFKPNAVLPYREPIEFSAVTGATVANYQQVMNQYTCALLPVFDSIKGNMHTTFFGGISLYDYDPSGNTVSLDTLVPFVSDVTALTRYSNGNYGERVLPVQLPALLGANAKFIINESLPQYSNGVIKLRSITGRTLAGYVYGGIRSDLPNVSPSVVNDTVYRVYITPDYSNAITEATGGIEMFQVVPNPAVSHAKVMIKLAEAADASVTIFDITGKREIIVPASKLYAGINEIALDTSRLLPGIYFCKLITDKGSATVKMVIVK